MITQDKIRDKMDKLISKEDKIAAKMLKLQSQCQHPNVNKQYNGNIGNYDPTADSYWIEFKCPDCDKRWNEDQ